LLSLLLLLGNGSASTPFAAVRACLASGFFAGLAVFGYFVFAFYFPVLLAAAVAIRGSVATTGRGRAAAYWLTGGVVGASGYLLGYALILREVGSVAELWRFLIDLQGSLGAFSSSLSIADRVHYAFASVVSIVSNVWHQSTMFWDARPVPGSTAKQALLLGLPFALWLVSEFLGTASSGQRVLVALPAAFFVASLLFGERLRGHHFSCMLPFLYGALAIGLYRTAEAWRAWGGRNEWLLTVTLGGLLALNAAGQVHARRLLAETGGRGLTSDAINRFAADVNAASPKPYLFLPDWGLLFPVQFLTRGSVPARADEHYSLARALLCDGKNVTVGLVDGDRSERLAAWRANLDEWPHYSTIAYRDRTGLVVFEATTFRGDTRMSGCPAKPAA
jgi:hypothetical protein